jgi:hypothetical protein
MGEQPLEEDLQKKMTEGYQDWKAKILSKARSVKDLRELRKLMYQLGDDFDWIESTGRWLDEAKLYEIICVNIRVPGLEKMENGQRTERYTLYGILCFSKAMIKSYDHLGDLERVITEKRDGHFYAWSTVGHGYVEKWPEYFPNTNSLQELYDQVLCVFERGDHSLVLDYPKPTFSILHKLFKNRLRIPHFPKMVRDAYATRALGEEFKEQEVPVITHEDLESKLELDWYGFAKAVVELDELVEKAYEQLGFVEKIKKLFRSKEDPYYFLDCLRRVIWNIAPKYQERYLRGIRQRLRAAYNQKRIAVNFWEPITRVLNKVSELIENTQLIQWQSFLDPKRYTKKIGVRKVGPSLSTVAIETVATGLGKILLKSLDDIAYPEKWPQNTLIKLVAFVIGGHLYRLMRSMYVILERRFKFIAPKLEGLGGRFDSIMASRQVEAKAGESEELQISEEEKEEKLKQLEREMD